MLSYYICEVIFAFAMNVKLYACLSDNVVNKLKWMFDFLDVDVGRNIGKRVTMEVI